MQHIALYRWTGLLLAFLAIVFLGLCFSESRARYVVTVGNGQTYLVDTRSGHTWIAYDEYWQQCSDPVWVDAETRRQRAKALQDEAAHQQAEARREATEAEEQAWAEQVLKELPEYAKDPDAWDRAHSKERMEFERKWAEFQKRAEAGAAGPVIEEHK